jgi:hypothetical protein
VGRSEAGGYVKAAQWGKGKGKGRPCRKWGGGGGREGSSFSKMIDELVGRRGDRREQSVPQSRPETEGGATPFEGRPGERERGPN